MIIEKEEKIIFNLEAKVKSLENVKEHLYHEYSLFETNILCLLTYVNLCRCNWSATIQFANEFLKKKCFEDSNKNYYYVLTYKM